MEPLTKSSQEPLEPGEWENEPTLLAEDPYDFALAAKDQLHREALVRFFGGQKR